MADQDQTSPTYTEEQMAAFEQYEKELEQYNQEAKSFKEHKDAGYDLYPAVGTAIGTAVPLTGAAASGVMNLGSKAIDAMSSRPSAGERWGEAVGGPGGKTVDEAVRNREIAKTIKPGEVVTKEGIIVPESAAPKPTPKVTPQAAKAAFNPEELDWLRRTGLLRKVLAGAGTGFDIGDAYKRYQQGDTTGAIISGLGALGYPVSKIPYPPAAAVGYGMMFGAPALNMYRDTHKPVQKASGGLTYLKKPISHFAGGGEAGAALDALKAVKEAIKEAKILKASEALAPHEGKVLNVTQSDRMRSTEGDLGGPGFSKFQLIDPKYAEAKAAWGVGKQGTGTRLINVNKKYPEGQSIWTPMLGSETQHQSNQHVYDTLTDEFLRQARLGKLSPELRDRMNDRLLNWKDYKGMFPENFDISNPEHLQQFGNTFDRRKSIAEVTGGKGVGGDKGLIYDYPGILQEMTDPMAVGAPTHSLGTRLFTLSNDISHRPDLHSAFPYILGGEDLGISFSPVPKELGLYDWIKAFKNLEGREPGYMDLTRNIPNQQVTEEYLTRLQKAGYAKGGEVGAGLDILGEIESALQEAKKVNPQLTQRSNTVPTYSKSGNILLNRGVEGPVIDFGSGLGLGSQELRKLFPEVHDYEPLAIEGYNPKFSKASDIPSDAYKGLVNHSVLNVLPQDIRDEAMGDIGRVLQPGGTGIITARTPAAVLGAKGVYGGEPNSIITQGARGPTFQKGFSLQDLMDYAKYRLGKKFEVAPAPSSDLGRLSGSSIMIQKKADGGPVEFTNKYGTSIGQDQYGNQVLPQPTELDMLKEMIPDRSTLKAIPKASSIIGNKIAEEAKKEWNKSGWRAVPDIALNSAALLGGGVSDLISAFSPSLNKGEETNPMLGVGQEKEKPNLLGSEQIHDFLREKGITKDDYPLAENALLLGGPSLIKRAPGLISKSANFIGEGLAENIANQRGVGKYLINPELNMVSKDGPRFTSNKVQFTSPLEDALSTFPKRIENMPGDQWAAWLRNQPANVRKEAEASGLDSLLNSKTGQISKDEVLEHLKNESPRIGKRVLSTDTWVEQHPEGDFYVVDRNGDITGERFSEYNDALAASQKLGAQWGRDELNLPDWDKNYREILLTNPWNKSPSGKDFKQGHYPNTPNLIAHLRVNDRTSAEGKPALFLEEVQSDWGQTGRKKGFDLDPINREITPEELKAKHYHELDADQKRWMGDFDSEMERVVFNKDESGYENLMDKFARWIDMQNEKRTVPSGPYVQDTKDWTSLAIKHAIKDAIENKKEQVAWTTGKQQNLRNAKEHAPKGMEDFYDNIMQQTANDVLKKLGVKERVRPIEFDLGDQLPPHAFGDRPEYFDPNEIIPAHRSKQWGFDITPELREKILREGIPKFEKGGSVTDTDVHAGGLKATNYPNPYGLRSWQDEDGGYHGQMMPKTSGWQGEIPTYSGDVMTEQSLGGNTPDEPFYPLITQNMTPEMIRSAKDFEAGLIDVDHPEVQQLLKNARKEAQRLMDLGKSPFKDYN